jgi:hypothetical protein
MDKNSYYLEEDVDAGIFIDAKTEGLNEEDKKQWFLSNVREVEDSKGKIRYLNRVK